MKISRDWLQKYFKEKLPAASKLAELFTFHAFEVEGTEEVGSDEVLDVKILPDRAHYALSHFGVAREVKAITGLALHQTESVKISDSEITPLEIQIEDSELCRRYIGRRVEGISVKESPEWLKEKLVAIGQRPINDIVDATNFVMFDLGQPLHAFDADKVEGAITIRKSKKGEMLELLKGEKIKLTSHELLIADQKGPLALAGIKGGLRGAVTSSTKNIILESANFDPVSMRKTATNLNLRNETSKRFENEISPELASEGMSQISALIKEFSPKASFGKIVDKYSKPVEPRTITVTSEYISDLLGLKVSREEIINILARMDISVKARDEALVLTIPYWRLDLTLPQDVAEEVGRIYGYHKIKPVSLPKSDKTEINKTFYWSEKIKDLLAELGYSEVYTYSLTAEGDVALANPLASDKGYLRKNLREGIEKALAFNSHNAPLLGTEEIRIFEIGNVFTGNLDENISLSFGYFNTRNIKGKEKASWEIAEKIIKILNEKLGVELKGILESTESGVIFECDLGVLIEKLPDPKSWDILTPKENPVYKQFSAYPFITRDIAVFVPESVRENELLEIIKKESGNLLVHHSLFDIFSKKLPDGTEKTSFAFRLVFQSPERTLTDNEINEIMDKITNHLNSMPNWRVR